MQRLLFQKCNASLWEPRKLQWLDFVLTLTASSCQRNDKNMLSENECYWAGWVTSSREKGTQGSRVPQPRSTGFTENRYIMWGEKLRWDGENRWPQKNGKPKFCYPEKSDCIHSPQMEHEGPLLMEAILWWYSLKETVDILRLGENPFEGMKCDVPKKAAMSSSRK